LYGSRVILVDGLIDACAKKVIEINQHQEYFNFSTMKEPYRLEGKKTMGYELAEQMNWELPDVILYPTGGGTGLIGMWKAFQEMKKMSWINCEFPRMIAVQAESCKPVVEALYGSSKEVSRIESHSIAYGLNVPKPFALRLIQQVLNDSNGLALAVSEQEILNATFEINAGEGLQIAPEGGALAPALKKLMAEKKIQETDRVLLLNTGAGTKYLQDVFLKRPGSGS